MATPRRSGRSITPRLGQPAHGWPARILKPGESMDINGDYLSRLYDLSQPGEYMVQLSRTVSGDPKDGVVKSNTIALSITDDDSAIEKATPPFELSITPYSLGRVGTTNGGLVVKAGAEVGINIVKRNTSKHEEDCSGDWSALSGLDEKYQYDIRDSSGNPVGKHTIRAAFTVWARS